MEAAKLEVGKQVKLRHKRSPVLCGKVTLPSGTVVEIDSLNCNSRLFWAKVIWQGQELRFVLDCSDVDE